MRRKLFFVAIAMAAFGFAAYADEAVLIDFSMLTANIIPDQIDAKKLTQNDVTMMDFSEVAGQSYTEQQKQQMRTSLAIANWDIILASSSRTNSAQALCYTKEATVNDGAQYFPKQTVFGVRVRFPTEAYNSWAKIVPPFDIPAFEKKATVDKDGKITPVTDLSGIDAENARLSRFEGAFNKDTKLTTAYGVVKNVGIIKRVGVWVKGLNFPHGLFVLLKDNDGNEQQCFMGYMNFDGWRQLQWENPQYVKEVRNRELRLYPLYPKSIPFVKFAGFMVTRDAATDGGDFVGYFKEVRLLYDRAIANPVTDIDDELIWGIVGKKEADRKKIEASRFGQLQVLRYIESMKQESKDAFTPATGSPDAPQK